MVRLSTKQCIEAFSKRMIHRLNQKKERKSEKFCSHYELWKWYQSLWTKVTTSSRLMVAKSNCLVVPPASRCAAVRRQVASNSARSLSLSLSPCQESVRLCDGRHRRRCPPAYAAADEWWFFFIFQLFDASTRKSLSSITIVCVKSLMTSKQYDPVVQSIDFNIHHH